ncbi:TENX protein, partial [Eubucco bourcierii]|nr:TENX protein [Eubucco bourcierii]
QPMLGELKASQVNPESVQLEWSVPEGTFDSFTLQYRDAQGQPQVLPVDGDSRTLTVPGLSPSRRYKFNLYGQWGRKRLGPVSTEAVTGEDRPMEAHIPHCLCSIAAPASEDEEPTSQPTLGHLRASQVTPQSMQLEWSIPRGTFDSFMVQYRDAQGQTESLLVDGGSRTVTVPGLSPSHRYIFYLYGMLGQNRVGPVYLDTMTGAWAAVSDPLCVPSPPAPAPQTEDSLSPPRLGELRAPHVSSESVQLEWSIPEGTFDSFTLQYRDAQGQLQVLPVDGDSRTLTVP